MQTLDFISPFWRRVFVPRGAVQGYKVLEVGADHVVVQDIAGVTEIHIPVYSVKAIVRVMVPGE